MKKTIFIFCFVFVLLFPLIGNTETNNDNSNISIDKIKIKLSEKELIIYKTQVNNIVQEVLYDLKPGTLKNKKLSEEEMAENQKKFMKNIYSSNTNMLKYYTEVYEKIYKRLFKEIKVKDKFFLSWHKKFIDGFKDSFMISQDVYKLLLKNKNLNNILEDKEIGERIYKNAHFHHKLNEEFENIVNKVIRDPEKIKIFLRDFPPYMYIEQTWK
ncbi:hypothetical protein KA977_15890 [Candidatus Dependentiae bacterium]|nr:hypothetical protein [Candidatus Dependentiae bacterium]